MNELLELAPTTASLIDNQTVNVRLKIMLGCIAHSKIEKIV